MEDLLKGIESKRKACPVPKNQAQEIADAISRLASALQDALPLLSSDAATTSAISIDWLIQMCQKVPSELGTAFLVRAVWEASHQPDETQQQAALFDVLGAEHMEVLLELMPHLSEIRQIPESQLDQHIGTTSSNEVETTVDMEAERRQFFLQQALEAQQIADLAQAEYQALTGGSGNSGATHTVHRSSETQARKLMEKTQKRATQAVKRAKEAGAIVDESELLQISQSEGWGQGGLMYQTPEQVVALQQSLLPEGSRQYYDNRGLPQGTIRESDDGMERVLIPAAQREEANLHPRLRIAEVMDAQAAKAFVGTVSLNPMQSSVFDVAYNHRDNLLVCAPTGAGKTNVALLTVVSHFRDVGLIRGGGNVLETGKKVVYIAPMKALAQEVVEKFSSKLKSLRLIVRELTGDMQLTRAEAESANVIVTTPEKWDVVTRKSGTDANSLGNQCGLLIIDEVHLLADERGAVVESVVARLHRLVESRQQQVRIVGLSATLPNYEDVADFLQVSDRGLFFFGPEHRPVPLQQQFIGVSVPIKDRNEKERKMNEVCYDVVTDSLRRGYQVMVFVHSRKGTGDTASALAELASQEGLLDRLFITQGKEGPSGEAHKRYADRVKKSRNREVGVHFENGMGIHHAGMLRGDRKLTEQMFADGAIKVLCCTATLAWGINLPAHTVVIKGSEVYNPEKGGVVDLSILDVQQIFGRAGRPQFDTSGEATLITTQDAFPRYMDKLVRAVPIESNFIKQLADHLNAEVVGGTVTNLKEAATWLTYSYLYTRMLRNPLAYGINADQKADDPMLRGRCMELVTEAAKLLDQNKMLRYDRPSGNLAIADRGRVAAHYYIQAESVSIFNEMLARTDFPSDADLCRVICAATEFRNMKVRQEEISELEDLVASTCPLKIKGAGMDDAGHGLITDPSDKAFVLLQAYISRAKIKSFTLISDMNYIASNAGRVARSIFEMCLKQGRAGPAAKLMRIAKSVDQQIWWFQTPLRHFGDELKEHVYVSIENRKAGAYDTFESALELLDMQPNEVGQLSHWHKGGNKIQRLACMLPNVEISCKVQPVTSSVLRFRVKVFPVFEWHGRWHGGAQSFWLWVEDGDNNRIHHQEQILFSKRTFPDPIVLDLSLPAFDPLPKQYFIRIMSDSWVGIEILHPVSFEDIEMPKGKTPYTDLQNLTPLPTSALQEPKFEQLYTKFENFNPIQTQLFHVLYHTDSPVLLGAPTGSGKTIVAEFAVLRMKRLHPKGICVYIAPLKSLARERLKEWQRRLGTPPLNWNVLELSGDTHHDQSVLQRADILVCTPEKWDLISRGWKGTVDSSTDSKILNGKSFVKRVKLLVLDEVHLLGEERGAVLEAIVSRTRFISRYVQQEAEASVKDASNDQAEATRIIGLSTAVANPIDLADWIGINTKDHGPLAMRGLFNFKSSVRPVPMTVHVQGYPGQKYCPRMASMNKPCFAAIKEYSPTKPVLIFVASRRQTRLTAFDIISYAASEENPKRFLGCSEDYAESVAERASDEALRHTITFGIGLHHAGLSSQDRDIVERMFLSGEIQVLVATTTLAWGVNLPAHLVIVKGTEYFDGKLMRYVDFPLTDVLQMIGRAGRPGFDTEGHAVVMAAEDKKTFYKKFLYSPFPVESCLDQRMCENINAEIASGTISSAVEAVGYLTWTFFARRVKANPSYYKAKSGSDEDMEDLLLLVVKDTFEKLSDSGCIEYDKGDPDSDVEITPLGIASSNFYLLYRTPKQMQIGVREARKIIMKCLEEETATAENDDTRLTSTGFKTRAFSRSARVDEVSIAWLLYVLSSTHEFDEVPVRPTEESLNEELSEELAWGPDAEGLLSGNKDRYINPEIFEDPHTKCFLLLQAHIERARLPISDYVNDAKSVIENVPRLLAAMEYIAMSDRTTGGTFELLSQFCRTKQRFETRSQAEDDPLLQLPGITKEFVRRMKNGAKSKQNAVDSIRGLRALNRKDAASLIQKISKERRSPSVSVDQALDTLFAFPMVTLTDVSVINEIEKTSGKSIGKLKATLTIQRDVKGNNRRRDDKAVTLTLLLGSMQQRMLLSHSTLRIGRSGSWTVTKELMFDWSVANADGGEEGGKMILRLLFDDVRGFDSEAMVSLR